MDYDQWIQCTQYINQVITKYLENIDKYDIGKVEIECDIGTFQFRITDNIKEIIVFEIFIFDEYRNNGLCKYFLRTLIDNIDNKTLCIESVISKPLYNLLSNFKYNDRKFKITSDGFVLS